MHACAHRYILSQVSADLICILNLFKLSLRMSYMYKMGGGREAPYRSPHIDPEFSAQQLCSGVCQARTHLQTIASVDP